LIYALSPTDLIPDFIPVLGYVDELTIVPLGVWATILLNPGRHIGGLPRRCVRVREAPS
jgi:hypothetical protein